MYSHPDDDTIKAAQLAQLGGGLQAAQAARVGACWSG
jgi:hypothetical protein